jgi:hypothetical protein
MHEPSYKKLEVKTNKQYTSPPTNSWRQRRTNNTRALLQTTGGKDEQTMHELSDKQVFVRLYLQFFVGGLMYRLFVFTSSCLLEGSCIVSGGKANKPIHEPSYKQLEVKTNKQYMSLPTNNWR